MIYLLLIIPLNERNISCRNLTTNLSRLARSLLSKIYAKLILFLSDIINSQDFIDRHRQNLTDFTRKRKISFLSLITILLSFVRGSYQGELNRFFHFLDRSFDPERIPTKAAFSKARAKLKFQAFIELNHQLNVFFDKHFCAKTWLGFRLLAIDGSTTRLPHTFDIAKHFGTWKVRQGRPSPMARLSQLFDPLNKITVDATISPKRIGERELAATHFQHLMPKDLILMDRGYPAWWLFALILSKNAHFCACISTKWKIVRSFLASGENQHVIRLPMPVTSVKKAQQMGLDPMPLTLRLIRVESDNKTRVLITSLTDAEKYPIALFADLYHCRWPVEEDYKAMKCRLELENFSGKTALSVYQDFHAKVLMKNIVSLFSLPVNNRLASNVPERKYIYQVNFTQALASSKNLLPLLFQRSKNKIRDIIKTLFQLLERAVEPIRPGRWYKRKHKASYRKYYIAYKPIA